MTQDVTSSVLRREIAKVRPEAHISDCRFFETPFRDWQVLEQDKAFAVEYLVPDIGQVGLELWKREKRL